MKILQIILKYMKLIRQGKRFKDKVIILCYFLSIPFRLLKRKNKEENTHKMIGEVTVQSKDGIFFCGDNIFTVWTGSSFHERELRKYFNISEGTFIDVGANIGKFSIIMGDKLKKTGKVISFEPHPENYNILKKNILLNKLKNVEAVNAACSNKKGFISLYLDKEGTGGHSTIEGVEKVGREKIDVKTIRLDSIDIKNVRLIKVDVEGAEDIVLRGAEKILKRDHPKILFESWNQEHFEKVKKVLDDFGYKIKQIDSDNYIAY